MVQSIRGLGLVGLVPASGELGWGEVAVANVWGRLVLSSRRQSSVISRASSRESKRHELRSSSRSRPSKLSIQAFCHGDPGSMNVVPVPLNRHQASTAAQRTRDHCRIARTLVLHAVRRGGRGPQRRGVDGAVDFDGQGFAGELVDHVEHLDLAAISGGVELEVHCRHHVRSDR